MRLSLWNEIKERLTRAPHRIQFPSYLLQEKEDEKMPRVNYSWPIFMD